MRKLTKAELQAEARSLRQFLTDPDLVGWFWPLQHAKAVAFLKQHDSAWFKKNQDKVLPPVPIHQFEATRVELESELLV